MTAALWLSFRLGARRGWSEKASILGQCAILWALIVSYGVLFRYVPQDVLTRLHVTTQELAWYLVLTEIMTSLGAYNFATLQEDIRDGSIEIMLLRPVDFWPLKLAEWFGRDMARILIFGIFVLAVGAWVTGSWPWGFDLALLVPIAVLVALIAQCIQMAIGCSVLVVGEARPLWWLWQKCQFLLGALLCPLLLYPHWLQQAVWFTPFPALIAIAGNLALPAVRHQLPWQMSLQLVWLVLGLLLAWQMARLVRHKFQRGG